MRQWQSALIQSKIPDVGINEASIDPVQQPSAYQQSTKRQGTEMTGEQIETLYGSDAVKLNVVLKKHPTNGLGLTLVDGSVNGNKGVYVKSVASDGDGRRKGLQAGDCILKISGVSLFNKSRHDAVDLVKQCEDEVKLEVLRFHSVSAVLGERAGLSLSEATNIEETTSSSERRNSKDSNVESKKSFPAPKFPGDDSNVALMDRSKTPPPQRKTQSSSAVMIQKRQRAVSDFGAVGDTLPKMTSDYLLASMEKLSK